MNKKKIENIVDFYKLGNELKYVRDDEYQTRASKLYGAIILATAINSEYKKTDRLGKTIEILLLNEINNTNSKKFEKVLEKMSLGEKYKKHLTKDSKEKSFALKCIQYEKLLQTFFEVYLKRTNTKEEDFERVFTLAKETKLLDLFGDDEDKNFEIFRFYYLNRRLKKKERTGWDDNHWNILVEEREKISEHIIGTLSLALAISSEKGLKQEDIEEILETLSIHEIGEIKIGDITPFDNITPEEKEEIEHKAMEDILGNLTNKKQMLKRLIKFDHRKSKNSLLEYYCDKLDADLQSKIYQDLGLQHLLTEQDNNKVFNFDKTKKMVEDGAETAFDIWYLYDKEIYKDDKCFSKVLKFAKNNKLKK